MRLAKPVLIGFAPSSGHANSIVWLTGANFSQTVASNAVSIGGKEAQVISASSSVLTIVVPDDAVTGKIVVISNGSALSSTTNYTVSP